MSQARLPRTEPSTELITAHKVNTATLMPPVQTRDFSALPKHRDTSDVPDLRTTHGCVPSEEGVGVPQIKGGRPGTNTHMYMGFVNWVSSTGSTVRVFSQASHSPRLSRLPISK